MFFRFGSAIVLVVSVSVIGIALEKRNLEIRRELSRQHYQSEVLLEDHAKLRLLTQQLGAPVRLIDPLENGRLNVRQPQEPTETTPQNRPLLRWQQATPF